MRHSDLTRIAKIGIKKACTPKWLQNFTNFAFPVIQNMPTPIIDSITSVQPMTEERTFTATEIPLEGCPVSVAYEFHKAREADQVIEIDMEGATLKSISFVNEPFT